MGIAADNVFGEYLPKVYNRLYNVVLRVDTLAGGIPSDPNKAEGWLRSKLGEGREQQIQAIAAEVMVERNITLDDALGEVLKMQHLNGFKRDEGGLYIEGRQAKACIKEAANIRWPKTRWGVSSKGTPGYFAEHIFVVESRIPITGPGVRFDDEKQTWEPTGVKQSFPHTWRGNGIQYFEFVDDAELSFTVATDSPDAAKCITHDIWGELWVTAGMEGIGAGRSQGYGRFQVIKWEETEWEE